MADAPADVRDAALAEAGTAYLAALDALDRDAALDQIRRLRSGGHELADLVERVLRPAQVEVGRRWEAAERSAAWEHAATVITESALLAVPPAGTLRAGRVVLVCAEGEAHSLPARMAAQLLGAQGWDALLLPPPMDAPHFAELLARFPVDAVGVSCTFAPSLPGCRPLIEAAHAAGLPVVAGGAAFDGRPDRAAQLGADACDGDPASAARRLATWKAAPGDVAVGASPDPEHARLVASTPALIEDAMVVLAGEYPGWPADWSEADAAREDFAHALGLAAAALAVRDDAVVTEGLAWRRRYWTARGEPASGVVRRLAALASVIPPALPRTASLLSEGHHP